MKMLIIDDSKAMRGFLQFLAAELGFKTVEAEDGKHGLDVLLANDPKQPFDIALVDWDMPRMTGIEFVELIRRNREHDRLKLMMVTTNNSVEKISRALQTGADDYLMKPVTRESLGEKLRILGVLPEGPEGRLVA